MGPAGIKMERHKLEVFADYHQFYLWDAGVRPSAPENYTDEDMRNMVKVADNVIVILPVRNMDVPVELELHDTDPGRETEAWDHVVELGVQMPRGKLQIQECTGEAVLELSVEPGSYSVRACFGGLETLSEDGLDGEDRYRIVMWPGEAMPLNVIKQWAKAGA